jgi:hypothetical protein
VLVLDEPSARKRPAPATRTANGGRRRATTSRHQGGRPNLGRVDAGDRDPRAGQLTRPVAGKAHACGVVAWDTAGRARWRERRGRPGKFGDPAAAVAVVSRWRCPREVPRPSRRRGRMQGLVGGPAGTSPSRTTSRWQMLPGCPVGPCGAAWWCSRAARWLMSTSTGATPRACAGGAARRGRAARRRRRADRKPLDPRAPPTTLLMDGRR